MCDRTKDDFKTVYQRTFTRKFGFRPDKAVYVPDYKDILAGPFTEYVVPNSVTQPGHPFEDVHHCCERLLNEQPKMKRYLDKEPSSEAIASDHSNRGRTVYMVDYCDLDTAKYKIIESEKVSALWCNGSTFTRQVRDPGSTPGGAKGGFESTASRARRRVDLPPNWGEIPVTTQKASYRSPTLLATWDLRPHPCLPRISPLTPNWLTEVGESATVIAGSGTREAQGQDNNFRSKLSF
ncbi:hypothetical protein J6590_056680 [Homalodisca vitripennis]|nr:hypothetical protein J6590_056680 [Homalodisca vitripennis]